MIAFGLLLGFRLGIPDDFLDNFGNEIYLNTPLCVNAAGIVLTITFVYVFVTGFHDKHEIKSCGWPVLVSGLSLWHVCIYLDSYIWLYRERKITFCPVYCVKN